MRVADEWEARRSRNVVRRLAQPDPRLTYLDALRVVVIAALGLAFVCTWIFN